MLLDLFRKHNEFYNIQGYDDIKDIVRRALDAEDNYNLLFIGPPASAKTLFLLGILDMRKDGVFFDGSNTTNRILEILEEKRPKIILLDELDKMPKQFQEKLLNFLESGRIKVDQIKRQYDFEIKSCKVFATANELGRLSKPLQSRFRKLFLSRYTEAQFLGISEKVLPKLSSGLSRFIGSQIWQNGGDIRDVISVARLIRNTTRTSLRDYQYYDEISVRRLLMGRPRKKIQRFSRQIIFHCLRIGCYFHLSSGYQSMMMVV